MTGPEKLAQRVRLSTEASLGRQALNLLETTIENELLRETVVALDTRVKALEAENAALRTAPSVPPRSVPAPGSM